MKLSLPGVDWQPPTLPGSEAEAERLGEALWQQATRQVQAGQTDDRWLYWQRLAMVNELATIDPALARVFENASRGYGRFSQPAKKAVVLITGFDPFHLDRDISQANPSGMIAQFLDGRKIETRGTSVQIRSAVVPVRFKDFDEGLIESLFKPAMNDQQVRMLVTLSMGRTDFDLERFPGKRRSSGNPDNENVLLGDSADSPLLPGNVDGPEFVEFSLPVSAMQSARGSYTVNDNCVVATQSKGEFIATSLADFDNEISVRGSGGGYLSNEISYRAINLANQSGSDIPVGHIHTPRMAGYDASAMVEILDQCVRIIEAGAEAVPG